MNGSLKEWVGEILMKSRSRWITFIVFVFFCILFNSQLLEPRYKSLKGAILQDNSGKGKVKKKRAMFMLVLSMYVCVYSTILQDNSIKVRGKGKKIKKKKRPCIYKYYIYNNNKNILYIVNSILHSYKILYMGCGFCYFYFLNLIHEN